MNASDAAIKYLDALSTSYEVLSDAMTKAGERGFKLSKQVAAEVSVGQREAVQLAKKIAADPDQLMSSAYSGMTEAAVAAQSRAFAFAQVAYQEALGAGGETRDLTEKLTKVNRETAEAAMELSRSWVGGAPMAEMFSGWMQPAATK